MSASEIPQSPQQIDMNRLAQRAAQGAGHADLSEQDRVEMVAYRNLPVVIAKQRAGKLDKSRHPWDISVETATAGFVHKFGRAPKPTINPFGPREETTVEAELRKHREAVETVVIPTLSGGVEVERQKDPNKQAPTLTFLEAQARSAGRIVRDSIIMPEEIIEGRAETFGAGVQLARTAAVLPATAVLLPMHLLGLISKDQLFGGLRKVAGVKSEDE